MVSIVLELLSTLALAAEWLKHEQLGESFLVDILPY
jgi:hypothetical protein